VESDESLNAVDEENFQAACNLELPISIRVWQRLPFGRGVMLKGDSFCDETYVFVPELIKQKYGPGEYILRPIEHGVLSKKRYRVKIECTPKVQSWKGIQMENKNKKVYTSENSQTKKEQQISSWLNYLIGWWHFIKVELSSQKCFLTFEDFISARRSVRQFLSEMEEEELKLITSIDAYGLFKSHLQRLCPQREQGEDDDASFSDVHSETEILRETLEDMREDVKHLQKAQSEQNLLLLLLLVICLILLLVISGQQPTPLMQQPSA
jgi:hypothetical protein